VSIGLASIAEEYVSWITFIAGARSIIFPFQQIQIHPNPSPNVFILLVDVTETGGGCP